MALQVLLVVSGGVSLGRLPIMAVAFYFMLRNWLSSVQKLSTFSNCTMTHVEDTVDESGESSSAHDSSAKSVSPLEA